MKRYPLLLVAPLLLLFISQCLGLVSSSKNIDSYGEVTYPSTWSSEGSSLGWLHTEGRWIKDANGRTVILRGAAWVNTCHARNHWIRHDMTVDDIDRYKSCGANILWVPLNKKAWIYESEYIAEIDNIVNLCEQRNIYVILGLHANDLAADPLWDQGQKWIALTNPTIRDEIINWEKTVASRYLTRSNVIGFGDINEPLVEVTNSLYSGYSVEQVRQTLRNFHTQAIRALRSVNPNLLIFVQGEDWGNDLRDYIRDPIPEPNVVYVAHHYLQLHIGSGYEYAIAYRDGRFSEARALYEDFLKTIALNIALVQNKPFFYGEFSLWGPADGDPMVNQDPWLLDLFSIMRQYGGSWTYWAYHPKQITEFGPYYLLVPDWKTLSHAGELWRNELLKQPW